MIYLLEDDDSIRKLVVYALQNQGLAAEGFETPSAFWEAIKKEVPNLILLDIMLPEEDGLSILQKLRNAKETAAVPIIMLTAKSTEYDRVQGLDLGADDYLSKPFGMMEMIARVKAVLRRAERTLEKDSKEAGKETGQLKIGGLLVDSMRHEVTLNGEKINLTFKEFQLLQVFAENEGMVLTRDLLMDKIWGVENERESRTLDVHIRSLRVKLQEAGSSIETVRGLGYRLKGDEL